MIYITIIFAVLTILFWLRGSYHKSRREEFEILYNDEKEKFEKLLADTPTRDKNGKFKPRSRR